MINKIKIRLTVLNVVDKINLHNTCTENFLIFKSNRIARLYEANGNAFNSCFNRRNNIFRPNGFETIGGESIEKTAASFQCLTDKNHRML